MAGFVSASLPLLPAGCVRKHSLEGYSVFPSYESPMCKNRDKTCSGAVFERVLTRVWRGKDPAFSGVSFFCFFLLTREVLGRSDAYFREHLRT